MAVNQSQCRLLKFPAHPLSFFFFWINHSLLWLTLLFGSVLLIMSPVSVVGDVFLEPEILKENVVSANSRVSQNIKLDNDVYDSHNNPTVMEDGKLTHFSNGKNDPEETLRQLSLSTTQPFIKRKLFNTSVALTVPMFSFTLPQTGALGSTVELANQAIFSLFTIITCICVFAVPVLFTGIRPFDVYGRDLKDEGYPDFLLKMMKGVEHAISLMDKDLQDKIGLNPQECLKNTICDAHRHPKKYGLFALPFHIFYPPPAPGTKESRSMNEYQMAAQAGEYTKEECWEFYNCFFDVLDLAVYLRDWFYPTTTNNNLEDEMPSKL